MIIKISKNEYHNFIGWAGRNTANRVYPLSIAQGFQRGDIYVNCGPEVQAVLFWHYCGFGYISGNPSNEFLRAVLDKMISPDSYGRLVLITSDENIVQFFKNKDVRISERVEYKYADRGYTDVSGYLGQYEMAEINESNISRIRGRIVPSFSWESNDAFLKNGFGYAACDGETICAAAFSAAVSLEEVDIGVETSEAYRERGLASGLADLMCKRIVEMKKQPVWAHAVSNTGSMKTALKCGFEPDRRTVVIQKRNVTESNIDVTAPPFTVTGDPVYDEAVKSKPRGADA